MEPGSGLESSPFASRLNSNYIATNSEATEIRSLLKRPTSRLEELSIQLQELDEQYTEIRNEQASLLLSITKHRALMSLVRKLPIEIIQEIFIACLPTAHNAVMSRWEPPILLTQICSSWRNIAHATPQLWQSIHIAAPCTSNSMGRYAGECLNLPSAVEQGQRSEAVLEWITRSATFPLDISLGQWGNSTPDGFYDKIIDYLIRFSERWREIRFSAPYQALIPVAALPTSKVPLLETLSLNCPPAHISPLDRQYVWITTGILKAPKLRDLWLRGVWLSQLNEDTTRLPTNWSQLTSLSLQGTSWGASSRSLSVSRAYRILSLCRNLITCQLEIGVTMGYNEEPLPAETISLPFLTTLSVREDGARLSGLFNLLQLPSLNSLEFHTTLWPVQDPSTSLLSLLTRITTQLITLTTDAQSFRRQDFIKCLRLCPFLKSLAIRKVYAMSAPPDIPTCRVDDALLRMFVEPSNGEGYLCPHLEDFESSSETAFSELALLRFVKEKNGDTITGLAKLKRLFVIFYCRPLIDVNRELKQYEEAGLVATISYPLTAPFSAFGGLPDYLPPY
jgi:F-box-like